MNNRVEQIESRIAPLRSKLRNHELYRSLSSMADIKIFMEHHIYAVWDFMSLLKSLQQSLTCVEVPWMPGKNPVLARFINEIVHGEESDLNEAGEPKSHFDMYIDAMNEVGANQEGIFNLIRRAGEGASIKGVIDEIIKNESIRDFLQFTFQTIHSEKAHCIASAFTFGREDVIPDMFFEIVKGARREDRSLSYVKLTYYLERHIEVDGGEHGPLSLKMVSELCGNDDEKWREAEEVAVKALEQRIKLWDGILREIWAHREELVASVQQEGS